MRSLSSRDDNKTTAFSAAFDKRTHEVGN